MRIVRTLLSGLPLVLAVMVAGCAQPRPQGGSAASAALGPPVTYRCRSGAMVRAQYSGNIALVEYQGHERRMSVGISADGARYVGGGMVWWTKGTGPGAPATLFHQGRTAADTGQLIESCRQVAAGRARAHG